MDSVEVAFDEAGNTGQNLLDSAQSVFTTAGVMFSEEELGEIRDLIEWRAGEELHFAVLKRSRSGRRRILAVAESPIVSRRAVKAFAVHKSFMVTTKIVDMLMEPLAQAHGIDLYERGGNLATANLFHAVGPVFCPRPLYNQMLERFVRMVRTREAQHVESLFRTLEALYDSCSDDDFAASIATLIASRPLVPGMLRQGDVTDLDPALPAFVQVATGWDEDLPGAWTIVHDDSKPLALNQDVVECYLANENEPRRVVGTGALAVTLPLKATELRFASSAAVPSLQLADLFASGLAYAVRGLLRPGGKDEFRERLQNSSLMDVGVGAIWPSLDVTPEALGREEFDGSWLEASSDLLGRGMERRYGTDWFEARRR